MFPPRFQSICTSLIRHKALLAHCIVIASLSAIAIWDAVTIIQTYADENIFTLVKVETINDKYEFLENKTIRLCYSSPDTIFQQFWFDKSLKENFSSLLYSGRFDKTILDVFLNRSVEETSEQVPLRIQILAAVLFEEIKKLDEEVQHCFNSRFTHVSSVCARALKTKHLDQFLEMAPRLAKLEDTVWKSIVSNVIYRNLPEWEMSDITLSNFYRTGFCVYIHLSRILSRQRPGFVYLIGLISKGDKEAFNRTSIAGSLQLENHTFQSDNISLPEDERIEIDVNIRTNGIYSRKFSAGRACAEYSQITYFSDTFRHTYEAQRYFRLVADECGCVPFTYRRLVTDLRFKFLNFCTSHHYQRCRESMRRAIKQPVDFSLPCKTAVNQFSVKVLERGKQKLAKEETNGAGKDDNGTYAKVSVALHCLDQSYLIFEERELLTPQQLLSQVGGDIGLYTGISILGVWQFLAQAYCMHTKRRGRPQQAVGKKTGLADAVSDTFFRYVKGNDHAESADSDVTDRDMEGRMKKLEEGLRKMQDELYSRQNNVEQMLRKLLEQLENKS